METQGKETGTVGHCFFQAFLLKGHLTSMLPGWRTHDWGSTYVWTVRVIRGVVQEESRSLNGEREITIKKEIVKKGGEEQGPQGEDKVKTELLIRAEVLEKIENTLISREA